MNSTQARSSLMLTLSALIWGAAFVAQAVGMDYIGPFTFNAVRNFVGAIVLLPCIRYFDRTRKASNPPQSRRTLLVGGLSCGAALTAGSLLQQIGLQYTSVGKAGFITALYIVIVPLLGIFLKRKTSGMIWAAVALALAGLYLLCIADGLSIAGGDLYILASSLLLSVHILIIDHFSPLVDAVRMSCIQFFVCGLLSSVPMLLWEQPTMAAISAAWIPIAYTGIFSSGIAYTLQIIAQKNISPVMACLILSLESVFAVLAGWLLLQQTLSPREITGCVLMFLAIVLAQLPTELVHRLFIFRRHTAK